MAYIGRSVEYGNAVTQQITGNNGASYTLTYDTTTDGVVISLDGVVQVNGTDFNIVGTALTFTSTVATGIIINVIFNGLTVSVGVPGDSTITTAKVADNAITNAKMADNAIDSAEIVAGAVDVAHMSANSVDSSQLVAGSVDLAHLSATGTPSASLALKGDYSWGTAGGTSLAGGMIRTNLLSITDNVTFAGTENGVTYGPLTIAATKTVTVTSPSVWHIL